MKTDTNLSRRRLLAGVPAVAAVGVPSVATALGGLRTGGDDPIFAAIEAHKRAYALFDAAFDAHDGDSPEVDETSEHEWDAFWDIFETEPTTAAGLVVLFEYLALPHDGVGTTDSNLHFAFNDWQGGRSAAAHISDSEWMTMISGALRKLLPT